MLFFSEEREGEREDQAQEDAGRDGKIERKTSTPEENIARKFPETRNFIKKSRENSHAHQDKTEEDQGFCKVAHKIFLALTLRQCDRITLTQCEPG
jgi:hypothetical protein